jgi:hypothetical protein
MSKQQQAQDVLVEKVHHSSTSSNGSHKAPHAVVTSVPDYLDEFDEYYLDHEKYIQAGHGGKQRNKRDMLLNEKKDPSGNVRIITKNLQNFEANRRKH